MLSEIGILHGSEVHIVSDINIHTALVVDDSEVFSDYFRLLLKSFGVGNVICHSSAEESVALLSDGKQHIQVIFIDLNMPKVDGLEFVRKLETMQFTGHIVLVSGLEASIVRLAERVSNSRSISLLGSLLKPIEEESLALLLRRAESLEFHVQLSGDLLKKRELKESILLNQVFTYFQPLIGYAERKILGFECLCRLDTKKGVVAPDRFIPVAEKFDLIEELQSSLLENALPRFNHLRGLCDNETLQFSFNVSPIQLDNPNFPELIEQKLEKHNVDKSAVCIEVTEGQSICTKERLETFNRLRIHDFAISLDDFGCGFTNLQQLSDFPYTEVKVDRRFCHGIKSDKVSQIIVESLVKISEEKGFGVVAEGVEDSDDLECLVNLGVDSCQGYMFSKPKPFGGIVSWLNAWNKTEALHI